jgi:hypothetical protein
MALLKKFNQFVNEGLDDAPQTAHHENYMFFGNLEQMKRQIEMLLEMDPKKVDMILQDGHNWAVDHIATSKDDIEEVFNFLKGEMDEPNQRYSEEELDQMSKDQMEHDEMMLRREQGI